ncbi:MAG: hypothetical protein ACKESB_01650 [Candidatus Hodgkinia cicadicola]
MCQPKWPKLAEAGVYTHSSGIHTLLPYAKYILNTVCKAFRKSMNRLGLAEVMMPCALKTGVFSRRLNTNRKLFLKINKSLVLAPTAEEVVLALPANCVSCGQYQVQLKFRNELRLGRSLIRSLEFTMKDGYIISRNKSVVLSQFKRLVAEYIITFKSLRVQVTPVVASAEEIGGSFSFEFVARGSMGTNTRFCVPSRSLVNTNWQPRWLSFTEEYVTANKIILDSRYLWCEGVELAHAFVFNKLKTRRVWFTSFGVGITRTVSYLLDEARAEAAAATVAVVNVCAASLRNKLKGYSKYIYSVLVSAGIKTVLFVTKQHISRTLGGLKRLPTMLVVFVNIAKRGFLLDVTTSSRRSNFMCSLDYVLTVAYDVS